MADTDRELLEMAARAAGGISSDGLGRCYDMEREAEWNPLTDDGDALRLAVKLNLAVVFHPVLNQALCHPYWALDMDKECREDGEKHADPYAATRRAIVRAAAEIGRAMP